MIKLENVSYKYASANRNALTEVNCALADEPTGVLLTPRTPKA